MNDNKRDDRESVCVCVLKPTGFLLVCHKMFIWHKILCLCMCVRVHARECYSSWVFVGMSQDVHLA